MDCRALFGLFLGLGRLVSRCPVSAFFAQSAEGVFLPYRVAARRGQAAARFTGTGK